MQTKLATSDTSGNGRLLDSASARAASDGVMSGVSREFHSFIADVEDLIKSTTSLTGDELIAAKEKISARILAARESVAEISDTITQRARKAAKATDGYVHDQPWQAIGIGAAVGVLVGYVLARRS